MQRILSQETVYKFYITAATIDCWLQEEFATIEEAKAFEKENLAKLKKAVSYPLGEWSVHKVKFDNEGHIVEIDGRKK